MEIRKVKLNYGEGVSKLLSIGSCCVITKDSKVLLVRANGPMFKFPGGHITDTENLRENAIREVEEETTLKVEPYGEPYFHMYEPNSETNILLVHYLAEIVSGKPKKAGEIEDLGWFDIDNLPYTFDNVPGTLEYFKDKLNGNQN